MRWRNFAYHRFILTRLKRQCTAPGAELSREERHAILRAKNLWEFDDRFTAPRNGYDGAAHYYHENAGQSYLGSIKHPTLLIHAKDDPFVPVGPYLTQRWSGHSSLNVLLPESGGHLGFHDPLGLLASPPDRRLLRHPLNAAGRPPPTFLRPLARCAVLAPPDLVEAFGPQHQPPFGAGRIDIRVADHRDGLARRPKLGQIPVMRRQRMTRLPGRGDEA